MSPSHTATRERMRCLKCWGVYLKARRHGTPGYFSTGRFTLKRKANQYAREIECPTCGSTNVKSEEAARKKEKSKQQICGCSAYDFRHEKGTLRFCGYNEKVISKVDPTDEECRQYEECRQVSRQQSDSMTGVDVVDEEVPF